MKKKNTKSTNKKPFRFRFTTKLLLTIIILSLGMNSYYAYDIFGRPIREAKAEGQKGMTKEQQEVQKRREDQKKEEAEKKKEGKISYTSSRTGMNYDELILNSGSAGDALVALQGELGIRNAGEAYKCAREKPVGNRTFYEMQQYYEGMPVYGHSLLMEVSAKGKLSTVSGMYGDIQAVNTETKIDQREAENLVDNYLRNFPVADKDDEDEEDDEQDNQEESYHFDNQGKAIYIAEGGSVVVYKIMVYLPSLDVPLEEVLVDARTGEILRDTMLVDFAMVTGDLQGQEVNQTLEYWQENENSFLLQDTEKKMYAYKAKKWNVKDFDKHIEEISWERPNTDPNRSGVDAIANLQRIYNYYRAAYSRNGVENNPDSNLYILSEVKKIKLGERTENYVNNAAMVGTTHILIGKRSSKKDAAYSSKLDIMGHEFNHGVVNAECELLQGDPTVSDRQKTEQLAIGEGLADVFGELAEDYCRNQTYDGSCNWENVFRSLRNPTNTQLMNDADFHAGTTDCHKGASLVSHPAYLIATGIDGDASKALGTRKLGRLFYDLIPEMTRFTDFVDFRRRTEEMASAWRQRGGAAENGMTSAQLGGILTAFDRVGIENTYGYELEPNALLKVYDQNNELYDNYHLKITPIMSGDMEPISVLDVDVKEDTYRLDLEAGIYKAELTDLENIALKKEVSFIVNENDTQNRNDPYLSEGEIFTDFGAEPRDVALALDVSGSMSGEPIGETRQAAIRFVDTVLEASPATRISIVTYSNSASQIIASSNDRAELMAAIQGIGSSGGTNIHDGLVAAYDMIRDKRADTKMIVVMSDGAPTAGPDEGGEYRPPVISKANEIKADDILIYALGFFHNLKGDELTKCQSLMADIASSGYHYEVSDADSVQFVFDDIAQQVSGGEYIYIRIACPVDVTVKKNGEVLSSSEKDRSTRTDFGTLSFEGEENEVKVLRLKKSDDYEVCINGTGTGTMDYSISFSDKKGHYSDERTFKKVPVTKNMTAFTNTKESGKTELQVDQDGDGVFELKYKAKAGATAKETSKNWILYVGAGAVVLVIVWLVVKILIAVKRNKRNQRCPGCGKQVDRKVKFCPVCGSQIQRVNLFLPEKVEREKERAGARNAKIAGILVLALLTMGTTLIHRSPATTIYRQIFRRQYVSARMIYRENVEDSRISSTYLNSLVEYHLGRVESAYSHGKVGDMYVMDACQSIVEMDLGSSSESAEEYLTYITELNNSRKQNSERRE